MDPFEVPIVDLIMGLAAAIDLVSPAVAHHHKRVAHIAVSLARELGFPLAEQRLIMMAAALHDIGAFSLQERLDTLDFELTRPHWHAEIGYQFFRDFAPLQEAANVIRFHHRQWNHGAGAQDRGLPVPRTSHLLHLADRIEVLVNDRSYILLQVPSIVERIGQKSGSWFVPEFVEAFSGLAARESFWLDLTAADLEQIMRRQQQLGSLHLDYRLLRELVVMLSRIIDFKSPFTRAHTAGVAATSIALAALAGLSEDVRQQVEIASYLHDLGKLAVPAEILEKPLPLTADEFTIIKAHVYHTRRILEAIPPFGDLAFWAAAHHERLDGAGYPFHLTGPGLPVEARIIAIADVFTALTEDRPYRAGMAREQVEQIMREMAAGGKLDADVLQMLLDHYVEIDAARCTAQDLERSAYSALAAQVRPDAD